MAVISMTKKYAGKLQNPQSCLAPLVVSALCLLCVIASEHSLAQSGYEDNNRKEGIESARSAVRFRNQMDNVTWRYYPAEDDRQLGKNYNISDAVSTSIAKAHQCLNKRDVTQARNLLDAAIKAAPDNAFVRKQRIYMFSDMGDLKADIADCNVLLTQFPNDTEALFDRAFAFFRNKQYQEGIDDMTRVIKLKPRDPAAYSQRAIAYRKLGMMAQAAKDDLQVRLLHGGSSAARVSDSVLGGKVNSLGGQADALIAGGQLGEAEKVLNQALANDPKNKDLHRARAKLFMTQGHYDDACKECTAYMTPGDWDAYIERGRAFEGAEKFNEALSDYSQAITLMRPALAARAKRSPGGKFSVTLFFLPETFTGALYSRARVYVKANRAEAAIKDCNEFLVLAKHADAEINSIRADAFEMAGKSKEALADYQVVIKQQSELEKWLKAETSPEKIRSLTFALRTLKPTLIHALIEGARVADKLSDLQTSLTYYSELIRMKPGESEFYLDRAKELEKLKQYDNAQKDLDKFLTLEPKDAIAYDLRARVKSEQGKYSQAVDDYTTALKAAPEDAPFLLGKRAKIYEQMGRKDLASKDRQEIQKLQQTKHD